MKALAQGIDLTSLCKHKVVADPNLLHNVGMDIEGLKSNKLFELGFDLDLTALYPSILQEWNIDIGTLFGKVYVWADREDEAGNMVETDVAHEFMNKYTSGDKIALGAEYLGLPSSSDIIAEFC